MNIKEKKRKTQKRKEQEVNVQRETLEFLKSQAKESKDQTNAMLGMMQAIVSHLTGQTVEGAGSKSVVGMDGQANVGNLVVDDDGDDGYKTDDNLF
eukprot:TRINITY_DN182765_c0_g1_i1.p3 TRINITY_DN182765_c0_g1~~TRINITY_DN182765_c0_g1_i1.p3  ORF type:complete len:103 (-),score=18.17 TRINITY_DN182765_c0_g1_i1:125-412(-)